MALFDYVQSNTGRAVSAPAVGFGSSVTTGNLIIVAILAEIDTATISSVVDNKGNTYTRAGFKQRSGINYSEIWYSANVSGGSSFTVTVTGSTGGIIAHIHEFVGSSGTSLDAHNEALSASTSVTATGAADLLFGFGNRNAGGYPTAGSGFTNREQFVFNYYSYTENKTASGSGSQTIDFSASDAILGVAFKGATTFTANVSVTATQTASVVKKPGKVPALVTSSSTVSRVMAPAKIISVIESSTVSLVRSAAKVISLATSCVVTVTKKANRILALVTSSSTVSVIKTAIKNLASLTATGTPTTTRVRTVVQTISVTATQVPSLIKQTLKLVTLTGFGNPTGTPTITRQAQRKLATVTGTGTASLIKQPGKVIVLVSTAVVSLIKSVARVLSVTSTEVATVIRQAQRKVTTVNSTGTPTTAALKAFLRTVSVTATGTPTFAPKSVFKIITVTTACVITLPKVITHAMATVTSTATASVVRQGQKIISAFTGLLTRSTFTAADNTLLSAYTPDVGPVWSGGDSGFKILSNRLTRLPFTIVHAFFNAGSANVRLEVDVIDVSNQTSLLIRRQDGGNYWEVFYDNVQIGWQLDVVVSGADNFIGALMPGNNGHIIFEANGNVITATGPGGDVRQVTDSRLNSATGAGIIMRGDNASTPAIVDNFICYVPGVATIIKTAGKQILVTVTGTPSFIRSTARALAVVISTAVASVIKQPRRTLGLVTSTATASLIRQAGRIVSATGTGTVTLIRFTVGRVVSLTGTGTPSLIKSTAHTMPVATGIGTASIVKRPGRIVSAIATGTASFVRLTNRIVSVVSTAVVVLVKLPAIIRSVVATDTASVSMLKVLLRTVSANATGTAVKVSQANRIVSVTASGTPTIVKFPKRILSVVSTAVVSLLKLPAIVRSVVSSAVATITKAAQIIRSANATGTASRVSQAKKVVTLTATGSPVRVSFVSRVLFVVAAGVAVVRRDPAVLRSVTSNATASKTLQGRKVLSAVASGSVVRVLQAGIVRSVNALGSSVLARSVLRIVFVIANGVRSVRVLPAVTLRVTASGIVSLLRVVAHKLRGLLGASGQSNKRSAVGGSNKTETSGPSSKRTTRAPNSNE